MKKQFKEDMKILIEYLKDTDIIFDKYNELFGNCGGISYNLYENMIETMIDLLEEKYKCENLIGWYLFDNDCGKNDYEKDNKKIKNLNDLWEARNV